MHCVSQQPASLAPQIGPLNVELVPSAEDETHVMHHDSHNAVQKLTCEFFQKSRWFGIITDNVPLSLTGLRHYDYGILQYSVQRTGHLATICRSPEKVSERR